MARCIVDCAYKFVLYPNCTNAVLPMGVNLVNATVPVQFLNLQVNTYR